MGVTLSSDTVPNLYLAVERIENLNFNKQAELVGELQIILVTVFSETLVKTMKF